MSVLNPTHMRELEMSTTSADKKGLERERIDDRTEPTSQDDDFVLVWFLSSD